MRLKQIGVSLMLLIGAASTFATPPPFQLDGRAAVRAYRVQDVSIDRQDPRTQSPIPQQYDNRRHELGFPDSSGASAQGERQSSASDNGRRQQGKMTPEERRALRRQIDEAGHDIYAPKR